MKKNSRKTGEGGSQTGTVDVADAVESDPVTGIPLRKALEIVEVLKNGSIHSRMPLGSSRKPVDAFK